MEKVGVRLIKLIGKILIIRGMWILMKDCRSAFFTLRLFPEHVSEWGLPIVLLIVIVSLIVPICYIVGGIGIFFLKRWGRLIAFFGLWFNVLFSLTGIASKWYYQLVLKPATPIVNLGHQAILASTNAAYLTALIEVIILVFLIRKRVRQKFS